MVDSISRINIHQNCVFKFVCLLKSIRFSVEMAKLTEIVDERIKKLGFDLALRPKNCFISMGEDNLAQVEILDIVDENDKIIGSAPRSEVHRLGLKHRAVHILVFNSNGQIFLQKRSMKKDRCAGLWDSSASGHLDHLEDYDRCARRELNEELGIAEDVKLIKFLKLNASPETDNEFVWIYTAVYNGEIHINLDEISEGKWFYPEEIDEWIKNKPVDFSDSFISVWKNWRQKQK